MSVFRWVPEPLYREGVGNFAPCFRHPRREGFDFQSLTPHRMIIVTDLETGATLKYPLCEKCALELMNELALELEKV